MPPPTLDKPMPLPRLIAWEVTQSCMLGCKHCRAAAHPGPHPGELTTEESLRLLDNIASFARPIVILTGGEPMLRPDVYDLAAHAVGLGLRVVMASCGVLIDDASAAKIRRCGIRCVSVSLDGSSAKTHDDFRGLEGAFDASLRGIEAARRAGLDVQINTTVTRDNLDELPEILELTVKLGASVFNPFLLVPTGRGRQLAAQQLTPQQYEQALGWFADRQGRGDVRIRVTCAPHYQRILRQRGVAPSPRATKGCMAGQTFAFISHRGIVQPCGFLDVECGDLRRDDFDFRKIWENSEVFARLRDLDCYHGRCGYCEFRRVCGGCRARAYAITGDYLDEEPFCTYLPKRKSEPFAQDAADDLDELDGRILSQIQADFPIADRPFDVLGRRLGAAPDEIMARVARLRASGVIRRLGAVFDSRRLGYASTLVAGRVGRERIDDVVKAVNELPGVTHNYRREHSYNLWFTLTAESDERIETILRDLRRRTGIEDLRALPALTVYKIRVDFPLGAESRRKASAPPAGPPVRLGEDDRQLVRVLGGDLPVVPRPFEELAGQLDLRGDRIVARAAEWLARGVIRRFGAVVRHRRVGFDANGMAVFRAPVDRIDELGRRLAELPEVSHCYRRRPLGDFDYNLFAMVHGRSAERVRSLIGRFAADAGISEYDVLFSSAEYKKTSMHYFQ